MNTLIFDTLSIAVDKKPVIANLSVILNAGQTYALMGPNGSGKSSLTYALMGHPRYQITSGDITFNGHSLLSLAPHERAQHGIFVAFQQSHALPGITVFSFLKETYCALKQSSVEFVGFQQRVEELLTFMGLAPSFAERPVNEGFSGGEKKRFEMVQALLYEPRVIILDEIDSGLDIDALAKVAAAVTRLRSAQPETIILFITHYQRMLSLCKPDQVFLLIDGQLADQGDAHLATRIETEGYHGYRTARSAASGSL
jgi:Fe-S cluster assembly ATP-binding protein